MTKNKNINITPSKGISIIIKNEIPSPPTKPKKKRKYKRKVNTDLLKMPTMPSYIPAGDVSYIKPQYAMSSLNRNIIFPGVPQSLPPPPQLPQITAPPPLPQITAPPQPPINISFDNMFGGMLENMMMPREYGYKSQSYVSDNIDEDVMDALPPPQQDKYIEKQIKPQIEDQLKGIEFDNEDDKLKVYKQAVNTKTAKEWGTKHANKLQEYDPKYNGNENYKRNYITKLQEIINQDTMKTRAGTKTNTTENKDKARELLKKIGIKPKIEEVIPPPAPAAPKTPAAAQPEPPAKLKPPATPPLPPQPPKTIISKDLLNELEDTPEVQAAKEKEKKAEARKKKK
jgi:hypothetical protein